jgi:hypothetical protein
MRRMPGFDVFLKRMLIRARQRDPPGSPQIGHEADVTGGAQA